RNDLDRGHGAEGGESIAVGCGEERGAQGAETLPRSGCGPGGGRATITTRGIRCSCGGVGCRGLAGPLDGERGLPDPASTPDADPFPPNLDSLEEHAFAGAGESAPVRRITQVLAVPRLDDEVESIALRGTDGFPPDPGFERRLAPLPVLLAEGEG